MKTIIDLEEEKEFKGLVCATFVSIGILAALVGAAKSKYDYEGKNNTKQAIIYGDNTATIVDVKHVFEGKTITEIETKEGIKLNVPTITVQIVDLENSDYTAEDIAIYTMGEDVTINYLLDNKDNSLVLK